ncbi:hypothetical protein BDB01DRAFT_608995 [Pilobolus umbonatus]|nr:hypothetical protein BDB01DRAFT_608995 [Pilobolus umbonatus]
MSKKTLDTITLNKLLFEQGYKSLANITNAMQVMDKVEIQEESVTKALIMMIRTHAKFQGCADGQSWNIDVFVKAILQKNPKLNWVTILSKLDQAEFMLYDPTGLKILVLFWKCAHQVNKGTYFLFIMLTHLIITGRTISSQHLPPAMDACQRPIECIISYDVCLT